MGYYENFCQLCAVSFNLSRNRTKHEPEEAGWGSLGEHGGGRSFMDEADLCLCSQSPEESGCENIPIEGEAEEKLHLPGPGCCFDRGYNGHRISVLQMKNMTLTRYIMEKPKDVDHEETAPDFEKCSDFFITDQSTTTQYHFDPGELPRIRYGIQNFFPQNFDVGSYDGVTAMPVHDSCWKIFERVSKLRLGKIDLQGLMALWQRQACGCCGFSKLKHDPMIKLCQQQDWDHIPGTEYFAANPHNIPGFAFILENQCSQIRNEDKVWPRQKQIQYRKDGPLQTRLYVNACDPFEKLPVELKTIVLMHLSSKDIAHLRLVSRTFRRLPQQIFKHLILTEMPWFWEIDEILEAKLERERQFNIERYGKDLSKIRENQQPAHWQQRIIESIERNPAARNMDWKRIYQQLKVCERADLGVRNRARVWGLMEDVVGRIEKLRKAPEAQKRYDLRKEDWDLLEFYPTDEEKKHGSVHNEWDCPGCTTRLVQRMMGQDGNKMEVD